MTRHLGCERIVSKSLANGSRRRVEMLRKYPICGIPTNWDFEKGRKNPLWNGDSLELLILVRKAGISTALEGSAGGSSSRRMLSLVRRILFRDDNEMFARGLALYLLKWTWL
jgi:hypothetical protein